LVFQSTKTTKREGQGIKHGTSKITHH